MSELLRPGDLKKISDDVDMQKAKSAFEKMRAKEREKEELQQVFMHRDVHPEASQRINKAVRQAAEDGHNQIMPLSFPASFCNDRGRLINNLEPNWPDSLEGFPKKAYEYYVKELKPLGYRISAQILDYPDGMPGTVGIFLSWDR